MKTALRLLLATVLGLAFFWLVVMKLISRLADRFGLSGPCPASIAWLVDNPFRRYTMRPVLGWTGIKPGETVLELGPGPGAFTVEAARQVGEGGRILAVDIQPEMIARLQRRLRAAGTLNVTTYVAGAASLPLEDASVDRAFLISVLPEIPDRQQALAELRRVLKPGGVLSISAEFTDPDYMFRAETVAAAETAGFSLLERHGNLWRYTINFQRAGGDSA